MKVLSDGLGSDICKLVLVCVGMLGASKYYFRFFCLVIQERVRITAYARRKAFSVHE